MREHIARLLTKRTAWAVRSLSSKLLLRLRSLYNLPQLYGKK